MKDKQILKHLIKARKNTCKILDFIEDQKQNGVFVINENFNNNAGDNLILILNTITRTIKKYYQESKEK